MRLKIGSFPSSRQMSDDNFQTYLVRVINTRHMNKAGLTIVFCSIICAALLTSPCAGGWITETVDDDGNVGAFTSIAIDSAGQPHIGYANDTEDDLKYARFDGAFWNIETVATAGNVGMYASLALNSSDFPSISYHDATAGNLNYAWYGATWQKAVPDNGIMVGTYTSLALDETDSPHISYYATTDATNYNLKYATYNRTNSAWVHETVDSDGTVGRYSSIALDSSGFPHISYYYSTGTALKHAWYNGTAWSEEIVDDAGNVGLYTSIAIDRLDRPHISYRGANSLKYAWYDGSIWHSETVDSAGTYISMALDSKDNPHIGYHNETGGSLKYAWYDGSSWHSETVDNAGIVGRYSSIALTPGDVPHISYADSSNYSLKHAWIESKSTLQINSTPEGAWIWLNGANTTQLTNSTFTLAPGAYDIAVRKAGYYIQSDSGILLTDGDTFVAEYLLIPIPLEAQFTAVPTSGTANLTVQFNDTSMGDPSAWFWDFGDGCNVTEQNPVHVYTAAGCYTVSLNATRGSVYSIETKVDAIHVTMDTDFNAAPRNGIIPLTVAFTDLTAGDPDSWFWDFGDGATSTQPDPVHTYSLPGQYTIALTAGNGMESGTETKMNYITAALPPNPGAGGIAGTGDNNAVIIPEPTAISEDEAEETLPAEDPITQATPATVPAVSAKTPRGIPEMPKATEKSPLVYAPIAASAAILLLLRRR
jgi:PKD repeat protein